MSPSFRERVKKIKQEIEEMTPEETAEFLENNSDAVLIDVRERDEFEQGAIPGAKFIPRGFLDVKIEREIPDKDRDIVLHCAGGTRSALAAHEQAGNHE
ncbi:MAG: rhodanese-like domain-containing protein [bacterium]